MVIPGIDVCLPTLAMEATCMATTDFGYQEIHAKYLLLLCEMNIS
jgi:hypothetical protein